MRATRRLMSCLLAALSFIAFWPNPTLAASRATCRWTQAEMAVVTDAENLVLQAGRLHRGQFEARAGAVLTNYDALSRKYHAPALRFTVRNSLKSALDTAVVATGTSKTQKRNRIIQIS